MSYEVSEVINFLGRDKSQFILDYMTSLKFPWLYMNCSTYENDGNNMFSNVLYSAWKGHEIGQGKSKYYDKVCKELVDKIKPLDILRIKANLTTNVDTYKNVFPLHTDFEYVKNGLTSIYYVNTNNGGTAFENGKFVKSEQNKLVTFPMHFKHRTVPHTDFSYARIVININYTR